MRKESYEFLSKLLSTPSPSGFEHPAQKVIADYIRPYCDEVKKDVHGNLTGIVNPEGRPRVMLAGHVDQIGLMVQHINDQGFIYFDTIGGIDTELLSGLRIYIHTDKGVVLGVIGKKPIHLMEPEERRKVPKIQNLWIDIGAKDKKDARKVVKIGDPITFTLGAEKLRGDLITSCGFDDKLGSFVVAETLRLLAGKKFSAGVYGASTVQEELGLRGARTSAYWIDPDVGIAIDVGFATDFPDVDKKLVGEASLGKGPIVYKGANINPVLYKKMEEIARRKKISVQIKGAPRATGTDCNVMQISRAGVATALIGIPDRYMHTSVEVACLKDIENAARLIAELIRTLTPEDDFRV